MSTTYSVTDSYNSYITFYIVINETASSASSMTSTVSYNMYITKSSSSSASTSYACDYSLTIGGQSVASGNKTLTVAPGGTTTIASGTCTVSRSSALEETITISGYYESSNTASKMGASMTKSYSLSALATGIVYIDNGSSWDTYQVYIDNGSSWDLYVPYIDNGSSWEQYG